MLHMNELLDDEGVSHSYGQGEYVLMKAISLRISLGFRIKMLENSTNSSTASCQGVLTSNSTTLKLPATPRLCMLGTL